MKKKIIIGVILLIVFAIITGCSKGTNENKTSEETKSETPEVKVEDLTIKLDSNREFNGMKFKIPNEAQSMTVGTYFLSDYMNGSEFVFRTAIYFFENKNISAAMSGSTEKTTRTINGREWHIFEDKSQNGEDMCVYAYEYNKGTYTITFIYAKNISNLIDEFMNNVDFE